MTNASLLFDKIEDIWNKTGTIWFEHTIELKENRKIYQRYSERLLLYSEKLRKRISKYYIDTDKLIFALESIQSSKYALDSQFFNTQRSLKAQKPEMSKQEAYALAASMLGFEEEITLVNQTLSSKFKKLSNYKEKLMALYNDSYNVYYVKLIMTLKLHASFC